MILQGYDRELILCGWVSCVQVLWFYLQLVLHIGSSLPSAQTAAKYSCVLVQPGKLGNIGLAKSISLLPSPIVNGSHLTYQ